MWYSDCGKHSNFITRVHLEKGEDCKHSNFKIRVHLEKELNFNKFLISRKPCLHFILDVLKCSLRMSLFSCLCLPNIKILLLLNFNKKMH